LGLFFLSPDGLVQDVIPGIRADEKNEPDQMINPEENCQSVSRFFMEQNGVEIGFTGFEFGQ